MNPAKPAIVKPPWGLLYLRTGLLVVAGLLILGAGIPYSLIIKIVLGLCLLLGGLLAIRFWQVTKLSNASDFWLLLNGLLEGVIGLGLLVYTTQATDNILFFFSFWGVLLGVLGAVETIFIFLGMQDSSRATTDFSLVILNALTMLMGGGLAFLLIIQPLGANSVHYAGLLIMVLGVVLAIETHQLKKDAEGDL